MQKEQPYQDAQLLQELARGNEAAMKQFFHTYRERLFYYITQVVKSETVAEELVMDICMKIWNRRHSLAVVDNLDAFVFRIARNISIDFLRSAASDRRFRQLLLERIEVASGDRADHPLMMREYEARVREAVLGLSPQRRRIYSMSRDEALSHDQIASRLGLSANTVNNHITEAQKQVRSYVSKTMDLAVFAGTTAGLIFFQNH